MRLVLLALFLGGCSTDFTVLTYNAGLAVGFVPGAEGRAEGTAGATVAVDADLVCLQEVWQADHVALFEAAADGVYGDSYFPEPSQRVADSPMCAAEDIEPLTTCMNESCGDVCADELPTCLLENCALKFLSLEKLCMECVQANVGDTADGIQATCTAGGTHYAYDGSFGTGLLSKFPLREVEERVFDSTTNRRSVLHAVAEAPGGDVDVYCTHLSAVFSVIPYPREEGSWAEEQATQISELLAFVDESGDPDGRNMILGDLNTGPAVGDSVAEVPDNWALLAASGMTAPYVDAAGVCTFCPDNPLNSADSDADGVVIDHVLLGGGLQGVDTARVLDEEITVEGCAGEVPGAHSDHYGLTVDVDKR
ncbi:MAG: endonuclease/exonuclease/phosphatase family protein [Deltaproteobacteria bacterium]|nr:endonuclease/exonuclease/phosphatase family protein [Deltaproteobacteria bacterium]